MAIHSSILAWILEERRHRSLVGYNAWNHKDQDTTQRLTHIYKYIYDSSFYFKLCFKIAYELHHQKNETNSQHFYNIDFVTSTVLQFYRTFQLSEKSLRGCPHFTGTEEETETNRGKGFPKSHSKKVSELEFESRSSNSTDWVLNH